MQMAIPSCVLAARYIPELWATIVPLLSLITEKNRNFIVESVLLRNNMILSWLQKLSLIDYPGKVACVVFTPGCNLRCRFCHNPDFVLPERIEEIRDSFLWEKVFFSFIENRKWLLDGVSICGGEPTLQSWLIPFIRKVKSKGFFVKLDTNGRDPKLLQKLIDEKLIDYIAMDVKHTWEKYPTLVGPISDIGPYKESVELIKNSVIEYEFRTTVIRSIHSPEDIRVITAQIYGARKYVLQNFRSGTVLDSQFEGSSFSAKELYSLQSVAAPQVQNCTIRF